MSWYDYKCDSCGHEELDIERSIKENVSTFTCPKCGEKMKQIFGNSIFKLNGAGWARDGYSSRKTKVKSNNAS